MMGPINSKRAATIVVSLFVVLSISVGFVAHPETVDIASAQTAGEVKWSGTIDMGSFPHSSPAIVDGTLYVSNGNLHALDVDDGSELWSYSIGSSSKSSPEVVDGTVYVGDGDGVLHAVSASDGTQEWTFSTGQTIRGSPTVKNGTVFFGVENTGSNTGSIYALDKDTGTEEWNITTNNAVYTHITAANGNIYYGEEDTGNVVAVDEDDGSEVWSQSTGSHVYGGVIYDDVTGNVFAKSSDDNLYAFDANDGTQQWSKTVGDTQDSEGVGTAHSGTFYFKDANGTVYSFDAADGTENWRNDLGSGLYAQVTYAGGNLYVGSFSGNVYSIDATDGTLDWTYSSGDRVRGGPTATGGAVYFTSWSDNSVHAVYTAHSKDSNGTRVSFETLGQVVVSSGGGGGGSDTTDSTLNGSGYTQSIFVVSHDEDFFNPQLSTIEAHYWIGTDPNDDRSTGGTELESTETVSAGNHAYMEMRDGGTYTLRVVGQHGDVVESVFFVGDASKCEDPFAPECSFLIELWGPEPQDGGGTSSGIGGIGDTNDDGIIDDFPDLEDPQFEMPEQETYLQTGIFHFGEEGRCVGLRYWDPSYQTTELEYEFDALNQTYSGVITFDDPVGYYEVCLDPLNNPDGGSPVPDNPEDISELPGSIDFGGVHNGSAFGGTIGIGGTGADFQSGGIIAPPNGGDDSALPGGRFPWILAIIGIIGWVFRDDISRQIGNLR